MTERRWIFSHIQMSRQVDSYLENARVDLDFRGLLLDFDLDLLVGGEVFADLLGVVEVDLADLLDVHALRDDGIEPETEGQEDETRLQGDVGEGILQECPGLSGLTL